MALTQMQIIQSLGEAMSWFERELNWEVQPTELRHLCGRIGELYGVDVAAGLMGSSLVLLRESLIISVSAMGGSPA